MSGRTTDNSPGPDLGQRPALGQRPGGPFAQGPGSLGMTLPGSKARDFRRSAVRVLARLRRESAVIAVVMFLAVASVFFAVLGPMLLGRATNIIFAGVLGARLPPGVSQQQAIDDLVARGQAGQADMLASMSLTQGVDFTALARVVALVIVIYFLSSVFGWAQNFLMAGVTQRTMFRLREDVDLQLGRLPLKYFDSHARGDLLSRVTNDIDNLTMTLQQTLTQMITSVFTVIGVLAMMVWISPLLAIISLLTVPLSFVITMAIAKRSQRQFVAQWDWTGRLNGIVEETHTGHELVSVFGHRQQAAADFDLANDHMYESSFRAQFISGIIQPAMLFVANLNYAAIAVIGGIRVASGTMSLGDVQAFIQYSRQFTMPITQIAGITNVIQSGIASAERVFELLDEEAETPDAVEPTRLAKTRGRIELDRVSFSYSADQPLMDDLSLSVKPGETVAIVGPTGAGKTTLVNLLMRFYDIDSGQIRIDGVDILDLTRDDLRRCFGMVLQDTWLFGGTIGENIAYGADSATTSEIAAAARAAHADHFVRTLPDGYDTRLDDNAASISEGEKQLLTIARAFLVDPPILILDEATSSVDTRTEVLIQRAMSELRQGRTSFVIAHRLSTIRDADTILVMNEGRIVEQGSHDELLDRQGFYYDLYQSQFLASFDEVADDDRRV